MVTPMQHRMSHSKQHGSTVSHHDVEGKHKPTVNNSGTDASMTLLHGETNATHDTSLPTLQLFRRVR